jgi:hypothetical protein
VRKWSIWVTVLLAGPFIYFVPVVPFSPKCDPFPNVRVSIDEPMSAEYRHGLTQLFTGARILHWHIGDLVLIPIPTWIDGMGYREYRGDDLRNAYKRAALFLAREGTMRSRDGTALGRLWPSVEGEVIAGKVYRVPDHVKALVVRPRTKCSSAGTSDQLRKASDASSTNTSPFANLDVDRASGRRSRMLGRSTDLLGRVHGALAGGGLLDPTRTTAPRPITRSRRSTARG